MVRRCTQASTQAPQSVHGARSQAEQPALDRVWAPQGGGFWPGDICPCRSQGSMRDSGLPRAGNVAGRSL